jgi:hypothetical protein
MNAFIFELACIFQKTFGSWQSRTLGKLPADVIVSHLGPGGLAGWRHSECTAIKTECDINAWWVKALAKMRDVDSLLSFTGTHMCAEMADSLITASTTEEVIHAHVR